MRPLAEAQADVLDSMKLLPEATVTLDEARGLVPVHDIVAPHDVPPFTNSAVDGYALRSADIGEPPVTLRVVEDVPAGRVAECAVVAGTAIKIMTGAPLPAGADAVVKVEDTRPLDGAVQVMTEVTAGTALREAGGDVPAGSVVLRAGERLGAAHLGVLASLGIVRPLVRRRPRVAVLSTGDEVVAPERDRLAPGKIRDSNRPILIALLAELGAEVVDLGIVGDDREGLRRALADGSDRADVVVTSGGVSMGEYDLVKHVLAELGTVEFWKVAMQPAKPFAFGSVGGVPLFGLPGNPVSVAVAFEQFVRPGLLKMMGSRRMFRPRVEGRAAVAFHTDPEKEVFLRVTAEYRKGEWWAAPSGGQLSNMLAALAHADAFAVLPVGMASVGRGGSVELEMFCWPEMRTEEEVVGGTVAAPG